MLNSTPDNQGTIAIYKTTTVNTPHCSKFLVVPTGTEPQLPPTIIIQGDGGHLLALQPE